jgi:transposase
VLLIAWLAIARGEGKSVGVIIRGNASWHLSRRIPEWIRAHRRAATAAGEPRLLVHGLPLKSPWLNPTELGWVRAKGMVGEPDGDLTPTELRRRLGAHFDI